MARNRGDGPVTLSIVDRLIDEDPRTSQEVPLTRAQSLRAFKSAVRRDLEWLLNTRHPVVPPPEESEVEKSLYMYGLPDITSMSASNIRDRQRLIRSIEETLELFEPRIANPKVTMTSPGDEKVPALRFVIEGMLRVDPSPEHVTFDTFLELSSGEYKVQGDAGAR